MSVSASFEQLGLSPALVRSLRRQGIHEPTALQEAVLRPVLQGRDVQVEIASEAERSRCLGLAVLELILPDRPRVQALVIAPSRPRAQALAGQLSVLGKDLGIVVAALAGGAALGEEVRKLSGRSQPQVLVGTSDGLVDHLYRGSFSTDGVRVAVLDGAEQMLGNGLLEDAETLCSCLLSVDQYLLFAARLPQEVQPISDRYLKNPVRISEAELRGVRPAETQAQSPAEPAAKLVVAPRQEAASAPPPQSPPAPAGQARPAEARLRRPPRHAYQSLSAARKAPFVSEYLRNEQARDTFVFCSTAQTAEKLVERLVGEGYEAALVSTGAAETPRGALQSSAPARVTVVTTEAAARGLALDGATHLIHFSVPRTAETYLERAERGASARAVLTLVSAAEAERFEQIAQESGLAIPSLEECASAEASAPSPEAASSAESESAAPPREALLDDEAESDGEADEDGQDGEGAAAGAERAQEHAGEEDSQDFRRRRRRRRRRRGERDPLTFEKDEMQEARPAADEQDESAPAFDDESDDGAVPSYERAEERQRSRPERDREPVDPRSSRRQDDEPRSTAAVERPWSARADEAPARAESRGAGRDERRGEPGARREAGDRPEGRSSDRGERREGLPRREGGEHAERREIRPPRDERFRRRRDEFGEPNFNRKGVAPEPTQASASWNSGLFVSDSHDRWKPTDRRGRPFKRPWLSEDDRQQRLYGNQLPAGTGSGGSSRDRGQDARRRAGEGQGFRKNGNSPPGSTEGRRRSQPPRDGQSVFRDDAGGPEGSGGRRRRRRRPRPSGYDG